MRAPQPASVRPPASPEMSPNPTLSRYLGYASSTGSHHPHRPPDHSPAGSTTLLRTRFPRDLPPDDQAARRIAAPHPARYGLPSKSLRRDADAAAPYPGGGSIPTTGPGADDDLARSPGTPCWPSFSTPPTAPGHTPRKTSGEYTGHSVAPRPCTARKRNNQVKYVPIGPSRARRALNSSGERRTCASRQVVRQSLRSASGSRPASGLRGARRCASTRDFGLRAPSRPDRSYRPPPPRPTFPRHRHHVPRSSPPSRPPRPTRWHWPPLLKAQRRP
jgi:hypothetical protein